MSYTIPTTHKVRALRIPADGSPPHILTLETLMLEPDPFPYPESYHALLSSLQKEESRHVPNLLVFWGTRGWQRRNHYRIEYECKDCPKLEGEYFVFETLESDGLQVNPHLSNDLEEHHGDAFVLRAGEQVWQDEEDLDDIMDLLGELRHHWLYPEFVDVDEDIVLCDIEQAIARLLWPHAEGSTEPAGQMDTDDDRDTTQTNPSPIADDEARTVVERGVEQGHDCTASSSAKGAVEIQENKGGSLDKTLPQ